MPFALNRQPWANTKRYGITNGAFTLLNELISYSVYTGKTELYKGINALHS